MSRKLYVWRDGKFVDAATAGPRYAVVKYGRAPAVHGDEIKPFFCDATGKTYTSRSERDLDIKASGSADCDWNWRAPGPEWKSTIADIEKDVLESYHGIKNGTVCELTEEERILCKEIDDGLLRKP